MKRFILASAVLGALMCVSVAVGSTYTPPKSQTQANSRTTDPRTCGGVTNTITYAGLTELWPPNHKMRIPTGTVTADGGATDANVSLALTVTSNELVAVDGVGDGNTGLDYQFDPADGMNNSTTDNDPSNSKTAVVVSLRGERSGNPFAYDGDGRTYHVNATAMFDGGATTCMETFDVHVPHDMGGHQLN